MSDSEDRPPRAWEHVVGWIQERILDGRLVRGSVLPAERDLAVQLGVSRSAVREGVRTLQASGVLQSAVGAGRAGGTTVAGQPDVALTQLLSLHVALANFPPYDVTQVRVALERTSATLAAVRADSDQLARMRAAVEAMDDDTLGRTQFNLLDTEFHMQVGRAAGNALVTDLTVAIRSSMRRPILSGFHALGDEWPVLRALLRREHHEILAAIESHQPAAAADLIERHIWSAYERMPVLHGEAVPSSFAEFDGPSQPEVRPESAEA